MSRSISNFHENYKDMIKNSEIKGTIIGYSPTLIEAELNNQSLMVSIASTNQKNRVRKVVNDWIINTMMLGAANNEEF